VAGYLPLVLLFVLALGFAAVSRLVSLLLGPKRPNAVKEGPYESGIVPTREPAQRFPVRFYLVAMIFIIFDIEIIFIYPWAVIYSRDLGKFGLIEMVVFAIVVVVAFLYLISNGGLDWGPSRRARPPVDEPARTTTSTVRRVAKPRAGLVPAEDGQGGGQAA
jgi:NADH-quinone oxidoreductase subunit A